MKQILFDENHDEAVSINDQEVSGFQSFAKELKNLGYEAKKTQKPLGEELFNANVLVIAFPQREFKPEECDMIKDFVEGGGGLFLVCEWANLHGVADCLNSISRQFGVDFRNTRLTDFDDSYDRKDEIMKGVLGAGKMAYLIKLVDFENHPSTQNVKSISYLAGCTLETDKKSALVWTDETCFADHRIDEIRQISEKEGPFIVAAFNEVGKGRVVCIGDSSPFSNRFIEAEDNRKFGMQIIQWLAGDR